MGASKKIVEKEWYSELGTVTGPVTHWDFLPKFLSLHYYTTLEGVFGCPEKGTSSRNYNLFVFVFQPK